MHIENMNIYKLGFDISIKIYKVTEKFPKTKMFGLVSQMRRAAISINSNICEGDSRNTNGEYVHFLGIAKGSASELMFQLKISRALGFIQNQDIDKIIANLEEVSRMLKGMIDKLSAKQITQTINSNSN